jgi:ATP-binding cassette, subfamily B, bacterial
LVWEANPRNTFLVLLLTTIGSLTVPAQIWLFKVIIDGIIDMLQSNRPLGSALDWNPMLIPIGALLVVLIVGELCRSISNSLYTLLGMQVDHYAQYKMLEKAAQLDMAFFETPSFYDRFHSAREQTFRAHNLARLSVEIFGLLLASGTSLLLLAGIHPLAVIVLLIVSTPHLLAKGRDANKMFVLWAYNTPSRRMIDYLASLLASRESIKEVRLFGLQKSFLERFREHWRRFDGEHQSILIAHERLVGLLSLLSVAGVGVIWISAITRTIAGQITLGELVLVFQVVERVREGLARLFQLGGMFYEHSLFVGNLLSFLKTSPDSVEGSLQPRSSSVPPSAISRPFQQGIEFRNVSFCYPGSTEFVLQDLSFTIQPGTTVAIVGENGAGKTTLVKLLARLYDPMKGQILLDGRDLRDYSVEDLHRQIGVIFQDFVRYHLTARENIGFGQIEHVEEVALVAQAAERGGVVSIINRLPKGYETLLGRTFEESVDLSGGEWQKLALSRAFMREAQLLILDEPTASLDALAEYEIYSRFAELAHDKTAIFISHRFSTVRMAQQILVIDEGRLIENGSHDALIALGGQYAKMFNTQAERYR